MKDRFTTAQRMAITRAGAAAARLTVGPRRAPNPARALLELRVHTTDPVLLGHVLGTFLYRVETESSGWQDAVDLLRAAGADETVAEAKKAEMWDRLGGR